VRESGRWHLNDVQRFLVALAVVTAMFLAAMSWGMENPAVLLVSLSLLVAAGLGVFVLGLRYNGRVALQGSAYVVAASAAPVGRIVGKCDMRLAIELPNASAKTVKLRDPAAPVPKWPRVGMILPVEVDPRNTRQLRVRWELVEPHHIRKAPPAEEAVEYAAPFFTDYAEPTDGWVHSVDLPTSYADADANTASGPAIRPAPAAEGEPPRAEQEPPGNPDGAAGHALAAEFELPMRIIPAPRSEPAVSRPPDRSVAEPTEAEPTEAGADGGTGRAASTDRRGMGVMLIVSDLDRSLRFYTELLGFSVVDQIAGSAVLSYGGGRVLLRQVADMSPVDRRVIHLHVQVEDVETAFEDLRARGIKFVHRPRVMNRGDRVELWAATFRDPDGHAIALTQWRDREAAPGTGL
jgi:catechol 2,3-dioxygenase-like lactoylglutathione lyase family enzyme